MGMERFALTTCARWGRFDAVDAMPLSDDAARDDSKHGRRRVRVMKQVVRLLHDRVLHVHLVAADVPVLLGDGVLEVYIIIRGVQGRVHARRDLRSR